MKKMFNSKMRTKIILSFIIIAVCVLFLLWSGYTTAQTIITVDDPVHYLGSYAKFTAILTVILFAVLLGIAITIPRQLRKSSQNLINLTKEIAKGNMDVEIKKLYNDEFGAVVDEYVLMVESIRNQAKAAQAVAEGDMTVEVVPASDVDTMGNALKTLVERNGNALGNINATISLSW